MKTFERLNKNEMKMIVGGFVEEIEGESEDDEFAGVDTCRSSTRCSSKCAKGKYCSSCCIA